MPRIGRRAAVALLSFSTAVATVVTASPAQAAYPTSSFSVSYGNSSTAGTITWYQRSNLVQGNMRITADNCRGTSARPVRAGSGLDYDSTDDECNAGNVTMNWAFSLHQDYQSADGAATSVEICLFGRGINQWGVEQLACKTYKRPA